MRSIQVRNVPDTTHALLRKKAAGEGLSMQEYLLRTLENLASQATVEEVLRRVENRTGGRLGIKQAARLIRADRDAR